MKRPSPVLIGILTVGVVLAAVLLVGLGRLEARLEVLMDQRFEQGNQRLELLEQRLERTEARLAAVEEGRPKLHLLDKPR